MFNPTQLGLDCFFPDREEEIEAPVEKPLEPGQWRLLEAPIDGWRWTVKRICIQCEQADHVSGRQSPPRVSPTCYECDAKLSNGEPLHEWRPPPDRPIWTRMKT